MSRLDWSDSTQRYYETGLDRGVLYVDGLSGVPWNGLIEVNEAPSGGESRPYYLDGRKYLNTSASERFGATIQAYYSPVEFDLCDGNASPSDGLIFTGQSRKSFSLCYRTNLESDGNPTGPDYKIHLLYNLLAVPASHDNATQGDSIDPNELSWDVTATPPLMAGVKPTVRTVIDSRATDSDLLAQVEDVLYGSVDTTPRLPDLNELIDIFSSSSGLKITLLYDNIYSAEGSAVTDIPIDSFALDHKSVVDNGDGSFTIR